MDVPFEGTISRYGSTGFFSGILHDLASARSRTLYFNNCDFQQHIQNGFNVTGNKLMWSPHESEVREDRASRSSSRRRSSSFIGSKAKKELGASALHLVCNCDETLTDIKMVVETSMREWMEKRGLE